MTVLNGKPLAIYKVKKDIDSPSFDLINDELLAIYNEAENDIDSPSFDLVNCNWADGFFDFYTYDK